MLLCRAQGRITSLIIDLFIQRGLSGKGLLMRAERLSWGILVVSSPFLVLPSSFTFPRVIVSSRIFTAFSFLEQPPAMNDLQH